MDDLIRRRLSKAKRSTVMVSLVDRLANDSSARLGTVQRDLMVVMSFYKSPKSLLWRSRSMDQQPSKYSGALGRITCCC